CHKTLPYDEFIELGPNDNLEEKHTCDKYCNRTVKSKSTPKKQLDIEDDQENLDVLEIINF
ncbi:1575_t:CDS:1, partial [Cetraspora pellucida]